MIRNMTKFNKLYDKILNEYSLDFTSPRLYIFQNILLEENQFLRNPKGLFQKVYQTILDLYKDKKYDVEVKLYIKDIINASFESDLKDSVKPLYVELKNIFGKSSLNYISIKISDLSIGINENSIKGSFTINPFFGIDKADFKHVHVLDDVKSETVRSLIKSQINDKIDAKNKIYKTFEQNIKKFRNEISSIENLAQLTIYPDACTVNENNFDLPTLEEAVEHEVQHLCIFLLSIAKTCVYFGKHFSNVNWTTQYELSEHEFITLLGSYSNILSRIYKSMYGNDKTKLNEFLHCLLNLSLHDKDDKSDISKILQQSKMFSNIKKFLKTIYDDKIFVIKDQHTQKQYTSVYENKKKVKLLFKWLYKNLSESK